MRRPVRRAGLSRRQVALAGAAGAAAWHVGLAATWLPVVRRFTPRLAGEGRRDHVALTFDDGPSRASTPLFLDLLGRRGARATFFLVGEQIARDPGLAREIAAAGHELAVHGYEHRYLLGRSPARVRDDLARATDLVATAAGRSPRYFRPPYGVLTADAALAARSAGLRPVIWTAWGQDWTAEATAASVLSSLDGGIRGGIRGGATLLLHDADAYAAAGAWRATLAATPALLDRCAESGLAVGPLNEHLDQD
jgi:peptidoglycan/xylan/chitin deacetylase (PgdA/CDA1 family)